MRHSEKIENQHGPGISVEAHEVNQRVSYTVVPEFPEEHPKAHKHNGPHGSEGDYDITFVFGKPGCEFYKQGIHVPDFSRSGCSQLIGDNERKVKAECRDQGGGVVTMLFEFNDKNEMSCVRSQIYAESFEKAESNFSACLLPLISAWSFYYDAAIEVIGYEIKELKSDAMRFSYYAFGKNRIFDFEKRLYVSNDELGKMLSAYRESLNSTNIFFKVLSLFKIAEGMKKYRGAKAKSGDAQLSKRDGECFPDTMENMALLVKDNRACFQPYLGMRFSKVLDDYTGLMRNAVAHLDPFGASLCFDNLDHQIECEDAFHVLRFIVRKMLNNEMSTMAHGNG